MLILPDLCLELEKKRTAGGVHVIQFTEVLFNDKTCKQCQ